MIKTKLGDLVVAQEGLQVLVDLSNEGKLAFTPGYGVARILKAAQPELEGFRAKQFELYKKYGEEVMIPDLDAEGKEVLDENTKYSIVEISGLLKNYNGVVSD